MTAPDLSPDYLDAIQARADAATEGPWHTGRGATSDGSEFVHTYEQKAAFLALSLNEGESQLWLVDNGAVIPAVTGDGPKAEANAAFTAHARTDVPALLALVRELQKLNDGLSRQVIAMGEKLEAGRRELLATGWDACAKLPTRPPLNDNPYRKPIVDFSGALICKTGDDA